MQNAADEDGVGIHSINNHVLPMFDAPEAWPNLVTGTAHLKVFDEPPEASLQTIDVAVGLLIAPGVLCVIGDLDQIQAGQPRWPKVRPTVPGLATPSLLSEPACGFAL